MTHVDDETRVDGAPERSAEAPPATPRWVKVLGIAAVVLVLLVGVMLLTGGPGEHGPGRHSGGGGGNTPGEGTGGQSPPAQGHTPPPGVEGHQPPPGGHAPPETTP